MEKEMGQLTFAFLETSGCDPIAAEISGNQVKVATMQVNISDISGEDARGSKNSPEECSSVIDTGFNGGGLRFFARLAKYLEYLKSFYPKANVVKTDGGVVEICVSGSPRARFSNGYRDTYMGAREFQTGAR